MAGGFCLHGTYVSLYSAQDTQVSVLAVQQEVVLQDEVCWSTSRYPLATVGTKVLVKPYLVTIVPETDQRVHM